MNLVDANVLLYAIDSDGPNHARAKHWIDDALSRGDTIGFTWIVLLAFLRLATNPRVFPRPLSQDEAMGTVRDWLAQPASTVVEPTSRHLDVLAGLLQESGGAANLVNDAHLAAIAVEHDAAIVSFDRDFARFQGVRGRVPE